MKHVVPVAILVAFMTLVGFAIGVAVANVNGGTCG